MSSLAQDLIDLSFEDCAYNRVTDALRLPFEGENHSFPAHAALASAFAAAAKDCPTRFSFDLGLVSSAQAILEDKESAKVALSMVRLPASPCWVEFTDLDEERLSAGVYIENGEVDADYDCTVFMRPRNRDPKPCAFIGYFRRGCLFRGMAPDGVPSRFKEDLILAGERWAAIALVLLALLNVHRASYRRLIAWPAKQQKRRLARGKLPLLSFNHVTLALPKSDYLHNGKSIGALSGARRLHQVIGHLRLIRHAVEPHFVWVDPYWRGDSRIGVILRDAHFERRG